MKLKAYSEKGLHVYRGRLAGPLMAVFFLLCHYWIKALDYFD